MNSEQPTDKEQPKREMTEQEIIEADQKHAKFYNRLIKLQEPVTTLAELRERQASAEARALQSRIQTYQMKNKLVELAAEEGLAKQVKSEMEQKIREQADKDFKLNDPTKDMKINEVE